ASIEIVGEQMRRKRRKNVLHGAVLVDVSRDAKRREIAHFVGCGNRSAEDENRQTALIELANRPHQLDTTRVRKAKIQYDQINARQLRPHPDEELRRALDREGGVA